MLLIHYYHNPRFRLVFLLVLCGYSYPVHVFTKRTVLNVALLPIYSRFGFLGALEYSLRVNLSIFVTL